MVREEKKNWKMPVIEYMMPLKKWESIDVTDESICLDGHVYQDKSLGAHDKVIVVEYEEILTVFDEKGRFIVELMKESPGLCGSTPKGIKDASGALEKHRIKEMFELVDKTLTECFCDPHVKEAYKERIRYRMVKIIDDAYKNREKTEMIIFVRDNRAVCPSCSGLMFGRQNIYTCIDCRQEYVGIAAGRLEGEVIVAKPVDMKKG